MWLLYNFIRNNFTQKSAYKMEFWPDSSVAAVAAHILSECHKVNL